MAKRLLKIKFMETGRWRDCTKTDTFVQTLPCPIPKSFTVITGMSEDYTYKHSKKLDGLEVIKRSDLISSDGRIKVNKGDIVQTFLTLYNKRDKDEWNYPPEPYRKLTVDNTFSGSLEDFKKENEL